MLALGSCKKMERPLLAPAAQQGLEGGSEDIGAHAPVLLLLGLPVSSLVNTDQLPCCRVYLPLEPQGDVAFIVFAYKGWGKKENTLTKVAHHIGFSTFFGSVLASRCFGLCPNFHTHFSVFNFLVSLPFFPSSFKRSAAHSNKKHFI